MHGVLRCGARSLARRAIIEHVAQIARLLSSCIITLANAYASLGSSVQDQLAVDLRILQGTMQIIRRSGSKPSTRPTVHRDGNCHLRHVGGCYLDPPMLGILSAPARGFTTGTASGPSCPSIRQLDRRPVLHALVSCILSMKNSYVCGFESD